MPVIASFDHAYGWQTIEEESVVTPNYAQKVLAGEDLPYNPYLRKEITGWSPPGPNGLGGTATERNHRSVQGLLWSYATASHIHNSNDLIKFKSQEEMENEVASRLISKVRNTQLNLGVTLGEFPETADFARRAMLKVARSYRQLRRGQVKGALQTLTGRKNLNLREFAGGLSDAWLAYVFGVKPVVKDVYDAVKVTQEGLLKPPDPYLFHTGVRDYVGKTWLGDPSSEAISATARCSGRVRVQVTNVSLYQYEQLGLTNPVEIAWELVPFSFVVDWFLPVGRWIENVFPPSGVEFVDGYTYFKAQGRTHWWTRFPQGNEHPGWFTQAYTLEKLKHRKVMTALPEPRFSIPDLSLTKGQVASAMALLYRVYEDFRKPSGRRGVPWYAR